jgi:hypothetical protein
MNSDGWNPGQLARYGLLEPGQPRELRPWCVYETSVSYGELDGKPFPYFVENGEPKTLGVETLVEAELFNGDLQKVDATNTASLLTFCSKYGLPASPLYPGAARLEWFRRRFDRGIRRFDPIGLADEESAARAINPRPFHTERLDLPESIKRTISDDLLGLRPALLSERARAITLDDRNVVGAISKAEVAQTVRALQVACVLPMAYQYFAETGGTADDLLAYLGEKRFLSQSGPEYFLHVDEDIVRGARLDTFENSMRNNALLPPTVQTAEAEGFNVRAGYDAALSDGLWIGTNKALRFLFESDASYRKSDYQWEWGGAPSNAPTNPFARFSLNRGNGSSWGDLPDFSATGSVGEAVIHQFFHLWADQTPWRRCENCKRIFKKYREEKFDKNIRETRFCRRSCNVSFNQRSKR